MANFTAEQQEWIANEDAISRQERLAEAIEDQAEAIKRNTEMMELLMMQVKELAEKPSLADQRCDFTGWSITEAITNLAGYAKK